MAAESQSAAEQLAQCLRAIQSFVIRRSATRESSRGYGRWFPEAAAKVSIEDPVGTLAAYLHSRGWPDDSAFIPDLCAFQLYRRDADMARLLLVALEESVGHKEPLDVDGLVQREELTVEHVLPQTIGDDANGDAWKETLGEQWDEIQAQHLHTLGNLTLSGYNRELSNAPYDIKRDWFAQSHLEMNGYFVGQDVWDAAAISGRGQTLAQRVAAIWRVL